MTRRTNTRTFPDAPADWSASSRATWSRLVQILENSELFDRGRSKQPVFVVKGTLSVVTTLAVATPNVTTLSHLVGRLLVGLQGSPFIDVRTTVA